jgi:two-component system OmpR family sensor kinase
VPILGWADAIGTRADLPPEVIREFAQTIGRNGRRLLQVVEALLRLAEIRNEEIAPRLEVIDMGSLARHAEDVARTYGRDVQVTIGPEATWVTADERYLREILHHVVDNAAKFTPPDSMIEVVANRDDTRIVFAVVDHGPGIPEAERIRAFDDVEQLEGGVTRTQGGIGAGLYIARALVEAHGGTISIRETPGGGATLQFTIPQPTAH